MTKINLLPKKTWKTKVFKSFNIVAQVALVIQMSYLGVFFVPTAHAATPPDIDGLIDASYSVHASVANGTLYKFEDASYIYFAMSETRNINDNVYSEIDADVTYDGWTKHDFKALINSDRAQFVLADGNFNTVIDITLDYLHALVTGSGGSKVITGYDSGVCASGPGVDKCDYSATTGASYVVDAATSLDWDINSTSFAGRSPIHPPANANPHSPFPEVTGWEYNIIYEMQFDKAALGGNGFGALTTPFFHNSPAKQGEPDTIVVPGIHKFVNGVEANTAVPGETLNYTINYFNADDNDTLHNVVITDAVDDPYLTYVASSCAGGTSCSYDVPTKTITWQIGSLLPQTGGTVSFQATIDDPMPVGTTEIYNDAVIDTTETDPATSNTVVTTVIVEEGLGSLELTKVVDSGSASPDDFQFTISSDPNNEGTVQTTNSTYIFDNLPAGQYTVTELPFTNYHITSTTCNNVQVVAGQQATCEIHNARDTGGLTINKEVDLDGDGQVDVVNPGGWTWDLDAGNQNYAMGSTQTVFTGNHNVSEDQQANYHSNGWYCSDQTFGAGETLIVNVPVNGVTCTFTNTRDTGDLKVIKHVINNNGGNASASDFNIHVKHSGVDVIGSPAPGSETGTTYTLLTGTYTVSEDPFAGYTQTSIVCDGQLTDTVSVEKDVTKVCTITNDDIAPTLTLIKHVINNNGGTLGVSDFPLFIDATQVTSGVANPVTANVQYTASETEDPGYTASSWSGDCNADGTITLQPGDNKICEITNDDKAGKLKLIKHVTNDNGGTLGVSDFPLFIDATQVTSGQWNTVDANVQLTASETEDPGYQASSWSGDCNADGTITLQPGDEKVCEITNDDKAPKLKLIKHVVNDDGGTLGVSDFPLFIDATQVTSGQWNTVDANVQLTASETEDTDYSASTWSGDCNADGTITLLPGDEKVCEITNNDKQPELTVYKYVVNDFGGTAIPSDFTMNVTATNPSPSIFPGSDSGTLVTLDQGFYDVTENYKPGYAPVFSADCTGTINVGESKTCIVTNSDEAAHLIVIKQVINDNGGTLAASDFVMHINGVTVLGSASFLGEEAPGTDRIVHPGTYNVTEDTLTGYQDTYSADCSGTIALGETKICTITNDDIAPELTVIKHVINNDGGTLTASDFTMNVIGTNVQPSSIFPGDESGTTITLDQGLYDADEFPMAGYAKSLSADCSGTINVGETKTCTVTNDDRLPEIVKTGPDTVVASNNITYTLNWSVSNDTFYDKLVITDPIPAGTTFVSASSPGTESAGIVTWDLGPVGPGDNGFVTVTVNVPAPEYNGTIIENSAEICGSSVGFNDHPQNTQLLRIPVIEQCDDDDHTTTVISEFDVEVDKDGPLTGVAGEEIDYTVDWSTSGNSPIDSLIITDTLPTDAVFVSASDGGVENNGVITWDLGPQTPGVSGSFTVTVTLSADLSKGDEVTNDSEICAEVFASVVHEGELLICDEDDTTTTIIEPILTIEKTVDLSFANPGNIATYTVVITNTGNETAYNVVLTDTLPDGLTYHPEGGSTKSWQLGDLLPSDSTTVNYEVSIGGSVTAGLYENVVDAKAENHDKVSDKAVLEVRIPTVLGEEAEPVLEIKKIADKDIVNPGDLVNYTVTVSNNGEATAFNTVLKDVLPEGFTFTDTGLSERTWDLGDMSPSSSVTINYEVLVGMDVKPGKYDNRATVKADNHPEIQAQVAVEAKEGKVLGLADTGMKWYEIFYYLIALMFVTGGIKGYQMIKRQEIRIK